MLYTLQFRGVLLIGQINEKSFSLRMATYRDGVKRKVDKIGMGV